MKTLFAKDALLPGGWAQNLRLSIDAAGKIAALATNRSPEPGDELLAGPLLPGMPNVHSHVWQRGFAGRTEVRGDFWSWRNAMYDYARALGPEDLYDISVDVYRDMLRAGYTWVGEFHYIHHNNNGLPFDNPAEMSEQVVRAALEVGMGITLLPVLYQYSNFSKQPPSPEQQRFVHNIEAYLGLLSALQTTYKDNPRVRIGCAPHSLRAIAPDSLEELIANYDGLKHIHIAEQPKEVADCIAWSGRRPLEWLLENTPVDSSWCLVHATQANAQELAMVASTDAVIGLCPTTEANLGDGIFQAEAYMHANGRFAIGSDSQISLDPAEELRQLEYSQRLATGRRGILATATEASVGEHLFSSARSGGLQALGLEPQGLVVGAAADLFVLDGASPLLADKQGHEITDSWVFSGGRQLLAAVMTQGQWRL